MDPVALSRAFQIYPEVKLVVVAHLYGTPGKIDEIRKICDENGALIIEDAAESLGAEYKSVYSQDVDEATGRRIVGVAVGCGEYSAIYTYFPLKNYIS
jgi:dTDP-4-amino-4,6-dideoxygalactose transaminase